jgi:hypothetical protein
MLRSNIRVAVFARLYVRTFDGRANHVSLRVHPAQGDHTRSRAAARLAFAGILGACQSPAASPTTALTPVIDTTAPASPPAEQPALPLAGSAYTLSFQFLPSTIVRLIRQPTAWTDLPLDIRTNVLYDESMAGHPSRAQYHTPASHTRTPRLAFVPIRFPVKKRIAPLQVLEPTTY